MAYLLLFVRYIYGTITTFTRIHCFVNHCVNVLQRWIFLRNEMIFSRKGSYFGQNMLVCVLTELLQ